MVSMEVNNFKPIKKDGDLYVEGTNKFSRFFIRHFHRSEKREITVPASLISTGTSVNGRNVTSPTDGNNTTPTASVNLGTTEEIVRVRRHRRHSKNEKLFKELAERAIKADANINLYKTAQNLGLDSSTSLVIDSTIAQKN